MLKKYFFYILILSIIHCHAMNSTLHDLGVIQSKREQHPNDIITKKIHNKIDAYFFSIDQNSWFRPIIGTCLSVYNGKNLSLEQAKENINQIKSFISESTNQPTFLANELYKQQEYILQQLSEHHWYVHYILQILLQEKVKQFQLTGKKEYYIPKFNDNLDGIIEKMIYKKALDRHLLKI